MGGKRVGHVRFALPDSKVLMAADLGEDLDATEHGRGLSDKGHRTIEGIRRDTVDPDVGMLGLERLKQAQGEWLFGGIRSMGRRFRWPLFWGNAWLLEPLFLLIPRTELRGWRIEDNAHGNGDFGGHQDEQAQALSPPIAPTFLVAQLIEMGERRGRFGARVVGVIDDETTRGDAMMP